MWQWKIAELKVELQVNEAMIKEVEEKLRSVEDEEMMDKTSVVPKANTKVVEEFKASNEFKAIVIECSSTSYRFSFNAY
ncbi:hypothetical protein COCNU_scaffold037396G000010 [Cocos nucifera]|nr:hypothetical protein [Cocos nucifera]